MKRKNIVTPLVSLALFGMLSAPALATEADFQKRMARGVIELEGGNAAGARDEFRAALQEHPDDPEANLYLAIALNRSNDPAAEGALKRALRLDPANPRVNLELGTWYYRQQMFDEAGDYFENLLTQQPDSEMKGAAEQYLSAIRARTTTKRWGVSLLGGLQYDSNVPLAADSSVLPAGTDRRGDWRGVVSFGVTGSALHDSQQELTGSYSLYQTLHTHLNDYNLTQNLFDVTYKRTLTPQLSAKASGGFEAVLLGGVSYLSDFSLASGVSLVLREGMTSGVEYRLRSFTYHNSSSYAGNDARDGLCHELNLNHRQRFAESVLARFEYTFGRDNAKTAIWSSYSHRGAAGVAIPLQEKLLLDLNGEVIGRHYDEAASPGTEVRSDTTGAAGFSLTWQADERLAVSAGYQHTGNSSNISGYSYTRGITSVMIQGRY